MLTRVRSSKYVAKSKLNFKIHELCKIVPGIYLPKLIENLKTMTFVSLYYIIYLGQVKLTNWKPRALVVHTIYSEKL